MQYSILIYTGTYIIIVSARGKPNKQAASREEKKMKVGDTVKINKKSKRYEIEPNKYTVGKIVWVGYWGVVSVLWDGIYKPVSMWTDEIEIIPT